MKEKFGIKIAPRRLIYVPLKMAVEVPGEDQECVMLPSSVPMNLINKQRKTLNLRRGSWSRSTSEAQRTQRSILSQRYVSSSTLSQTLEICVFFISFKPTWSTWYTLAIYSRQLRQLLVTNLKSPFNIEENHVFLCKLCTRQFPKQSYGERGIS